MNRTLLAAALATLAAPALAQTQTPMTEANLSPMTVILRDLTTDDCWSDPKAAADLARDELAKTTIELVDTEDEAETVFVVLVQARRSDTGCHGYVRFSVGSMIDWKGNGDVAATLQAVSEIFDGLDTVDGFVTDGLSKSIPALADFLPDS